MRRTSFFFVCFLAGCTCGGGNETLTRVTSFASSTNCQSGGVVIATGKDANANGKLDDAEVKESNEVCSGTSATAGKTSLVETTDVPVGDSRCAEGGVKLDLGLDDGTGGGTAGNGKLETGEIVETRYICNGSTPYYPGSIAAPANPAGTFRIETSGGAGTGAQGGTPGNIVVRITSGTLGGHTRVFKTGVTNADFTPPNSGTFQGGTVPFTVSADLTVNHFVDTTAGLGSGDAIFLVDNDDTLYKPQGGGVAVAVTGLAVASGATLTLDQNFNAQARLRLRADVKNSGTITTTLLGDGLSRASLQLVCGTWFGETGSAINLRGMNTAAGTGGNGGVLLVVGTARVVNQGSATTTGGDGDDGAPGGSLTLSSLTGEVFNTGTLESKGGNGSVGNGAAGGTVQLSAASRGVRNSGGIDNTGGNGGPNGGGGGNIVLAPQAFGLVYNSGTLTTRGGLCADVDCNGGGGGVVVLSAAGCELKNSGLLTTTGGDGKGVGNGGNGGNVSVRVDDAANDASGLVLSAGELQLSGNIVTRGGVGNVGGAGGAVTVVLDTSHQPQGQQLTLLGYADLISNGGASATVGGAAGGDISISNAPSRYHDSITAAGGGALNAAAITAKGGDGNPAGNGGRFTLAAQVTFNFSNPNEFATNSGTVDVRGGQGDNTNAGGGGIVRVLGPATATNSGAVNASGGAVILGNNNGGPGGQFIVSSPYGSATNTGAILATGGTSTGDSTGGGEARLVSATTVNSGAINCNGGNATNNAGGGGLIFLNSTSSMSNNTGTLSVASGTGTNAGGRGTILIDGADVTP